LLFKKPIKMRYYLLLLALSVYACNNNNTVITDYSTETVCDTNFIRTTNYSVFPTGLLDQIINAGKLSKFLYDAAYDELLNKITAVIIKTNKQFSNPVLNSLKDSVVYDNSAPSIENTDSLFKSDLVMCLNKLIVFEKSYEIKNIDEKNSEMRLTLEINTDEVLRLYLKNEEIIFPVSGINIPEALNTKQTIESFKKIFLEELKQYEKENQNSGEVKYQN